MILHSTGVNITVSPSEYQNASPYPCAVIDDFLPKDIADEALKSFPKPEDPVWREHGREYINQGNGRKFEMSKKEAMPPALQRVVEIVNGPDFGRQLAELTGFSDLIADPSLFGGGLNLADGGGFLRVHADFNFNNDLNAYRTINVLLYFSKGWEEQFGGVLELWERDLSKCSRKVLPKFNRAVIFTTFSDAYHGVSQVNAPEGLCRRSMNFYFYREKAAPGIRSEPHKTLWQKVDA